MNNEFFLWKRFIARAIDDLIFVNLIVLVFSSFSNLDWKYLYLLAWFLVVPIETLQLVLFGTTIGKRILNLKVSTSSANRSSSFFKRSVLVWLFGTAAGLPIICLVAMAYWYIKLNNGGRAYWDKAAATQIELYK